MYEFTYTPKLFRKMKQHLQSSESDKDIVEENEIKVNIFK